MTKQELLLQTFQSKFDLAQYKKFIIEFFNDAKLTNGEKRQDRWNWNEYAFYINGYYHVADYIDEKRNKIAIFAVELKKGKSLEKARSKQRNFIADRIKTMGYDGAIAAFYSEDETENRWRLSFVRLDYELLKGKIKTNFTPAKRYSYLLGVGEPCHTAMQQLYPILEEEKFNPSIDKLEEAFSVEKVTKQFFEKYKEKYIELYEYLSKNDTFRDEAIRCVKSDNEDDIFKFTEQFAKKLMGQVVFMYFLQKKGWLGVNAFPPKITEREYKNAFFDCNAEHKEILKQLYVLGEGGAYVRQAKIINSLSEEDQTYFAARIKGMPWETGPKHFVRILFNEALKHNRNYFEYYLEPLFYEALNEKREANNYYARLHCRIPFLNGGLFEPLDGYDWRHNNFSIPNEIFSNANIKGDREADGILDIFDRYNFTMNEDEPLEKEVAVDPEMLGKIFENLLDVKDRKSKGAFYTPREIVHYMCQESLINYIVNTVGTPYEDTKDFILYGEIMKDEDCSREVKEGYAEMLMPESIYKNLKAIDDALADVRVADPAVGSGAFPMGMVNEIVKARENITAYFAREATAAQARQLWNFTRHPYMLKRDAMKNSIFAVDVEPSAVDITKLRLWLSLVVEFDINSENDEFKAPPTLPNLECNILCGNSLIDEFEGVNLFNDSLLTGAGNNSNWMADLFQNQVDKMLEKLIEKQKELFYANNHNDKYRLKHEIEVLQQQVIFASCTMTDDIKERFISTFDMPSKPYIIWKLAFAKVFKEKGGFDIVIGNPPYVSTKSVSTESKKEYERVYGFSDDTYNLFTFRGMMLLKQQGSVNYIIPKTFWTTQTKRNMRDLLLKNTINYIFDTANPFESAMVDTCVIQATKCVSNGTNIILFLDGSKDLKTPLTYSVEQNVYINAQNRVIFKPSPFNMRIYQLYGTKVKELYDKWWDCIKTSKDIEKNAERLEAYRKTLRPGDITLLGCLTEGGQGLATANNGKYIAVRKSTKWAKNILASRPVKLSEAMREKKIPLSVLQPYSSVDEFFKNATENDIVALFDDLKEKYGRDIFGQGYIFRLIDDAEMADVSTLTDDEKENGIDVSKKYYVPYDKGDKDGNRWYLETPFAIAWSKENVQFLKTNSGKKGAGMPVVRNPQFNFREGFCWNNVLNPNARLLKVKLKSATVNDVGSMSLISCFDYLPNYFFVAILNSNVIFDYYREFINCTVNIQINDLRQIPIIIPNKEQLDSIEKLFNEIYLEKKNAFDLGESYTISKQEENLDKIVSLLYLI
ncbi:MAG: Eco57I restriction-modification methylase domain-containing protein [Candidatus Coproplasma sp.]